MIQYADPCQAAAQASFDCLERTHYNRQEVSARPGHDLCKIHDSPQGKAILMSSAWITSRRIGTARRNG